MKKIIVAIDGFSSTGKSTLAKQLAQKIDYIYIDSGAMYRAITYYFILKKVDIKNTDLVSEILKEISIHFVNQEVAINDEIVEDKIRTMQIANMVSEVATIEQVRTFAVAQQQAFGIEKGIVMDGRDVGTTVFPHAELKIYLCASQAVRTQRRFKEMKASNPNITIEEVEENLLHRDYIDSNREISPLRIAADAVVLDNSELSIEEQLEIATKWVQKLI